MKNKFSSRKIALLGLFLAVALIVSLIESALPAIVPALPYIKIGLANVVLLACFLLLGIGEGYIVLILRCVFSAIFAANLTSLLWSLPAAFISYTIMVLLKKCKIFSTTGISMAGGIVHNVVQIIVAIFVVGDSVALYLPYMILAGGIAGLVTGIICHFFYERFKYNFDTLDVENIEYIREENGD